jgi:hypothetical protein
VFTQARLREWLRQHQFRLAAGNHLPSITDISRRSGVHRDTIYSFLSGARISERTQLGLSRAVVEIESETSRIERTRVMAIHLADGRLSLKCGASSPHSFVSDINYLSS